MPGRATAFSDGRHALLADTANGRVLMLDPTQDHKLLQAIAVGPKPGRIQVSVDDKSVAVALASEPRAVLMSFPGYRGDPPGLRDLAAGPGPASGPRAMSYEQGWLAIADGDGAITLDEVATGKSRRIEGLGTPGPLAVGQTDGTATTLIVGDTASDAIVLVDIASGAVTRVSDAGRGPAGVALDDELGLAFVSMAGSDEVAVVNYWKKTLVARLPVGKRPGAIYRAPLLPVSRYRVMHLGTTDQFWVSNDGAPTVTVIDGKGLTVKATLAVGDGPHGVAFWGPSALVTNAGSDDVSLIDRTRLPL